MKQQKILVIGASGFTGKCVLAELEKTNHQITLFLRPETAQHFPIPKGMTVAIGTLEDPTSLTQALKGQDALLFIASMGFGHMPDVIAACEAANVKRGIFISSTAIFTGLNAKSKDGRAAGEAAVTNSNLNYTILRPTMIYGRKGDRNMERLVRHLKKWRILPLPGGGNALQQPIFVDDVAKAVVQAVESPNTIRKAYNISGAQPLTFKQVTHTIAHTLGIKIWLVPLPLAPFCWLLRFYAMLIKKPRLKEEQLLRLNENKDFDHTNATKDFGFTPRSFEDGIQNLIKELS